MTTSNIWEINSRLARVLPLLRDEAALSRLVQHVHPDAPADQVHLLVDDLSTLVTHDLPALAAALLRTKALHPVTGRLWVAQPRLQPIRPVRVIDAEESS